MTTESNNQHEHNRLNNESSEGSHESSVGRAMNSTDYRWNQRIKNTGARQGFMGMPQEDGWKSIEATLKMRSEFKDQVELDFDSSLETRYEQLLRERLESIKTQIEPRLIDAREKATRLTTNNFTPNGARIMIAIGWSCVTALGWVFSWILARIIGSDSLSDGAVNDIVALFVKGFSDLNKMILNTFPMFKQYEWVLLLSGIILVLLAILAYLNVHRLSGNMRVVEYIIGAFSQTLTKPDIEDMKHDFDTKDLARQRANWLIVSIALGLPGLGLLLSSIQKDYSLSMILLGYSLAAVVVAVLMLTILFNRPKDKSELPPGFLPPWLLKGIQVSTIFLFAALFLSLLLRSYPEYTEFARSLTIFSIGCFFLPGTSILAIGYIHQNVFKNEHYWLKVKAHIDFRLRKLQSRIDWRENDRRQRTTDSKAAQDSMNKKLENYRIIYNEAYHLGQTASNVNHSNN